MLRTTSVLRATNELLSLAGRLTGVVATGEASLRLMMAGGGISVVWDRLTGAGILRDSRKLMDRLLLELEELCVKRRLRCSHGLDNSGEMGDVRRELVDLDTVGGMLRLHVLKLVMVLLMQLTSNTLRRLGCNVSESRGESLSQCCDNFLLDTSGNIVSNSFRHSLDKIARAQGPVERVRKGVLDLLLHTRSKVRLQLVIEKIGNSGTSLVSNGGDNELSELVVDKSLQDLLSVFVQHLRNHIKEFELVLVEILVPNTDIVINLAMKVLERRLERLTNAQVQAALKSRDGSIECLRRDSRRSSVVCALGILIASTRCGPVGGNITLTGTPWRTGWAFQLPLAHSLPWLGQPVRVHAEQTRSEIRGFSIAGRSWGLGRLGSLELRHSDDVLGDGINCIEDLVVLGPSKLGLLDKKASNALGVHGIQLKECGLVKILDHSRCAEDVKTSQNAPVSERVLSHTTNDSGTIRLRDGGVLSNKSLDVLGLGDALEVILRLAKSKIPKLQGVVLLHSNNHVSESTSLLVGSLLVEEQDRSGPGLLTLRSGGKSHQRLLDLERGLRGDRSAWVRTLLDGGQVSNIPELDPTRLIKRDDDRVVLTEGEVLAGLTSVDLQGALLGKGFRVDNTIMAWLEQVVLQNVRRPDEVDRLAATNSKVLGVDCGSASAGLENTARGVTLLGAHGRQSEAVLLHMSILDVILLAIANLNPVDGATDASPDNGLAVSAFVIGGRDRHGDVENAILGVGKDLGILTILLSDDTETSLLGHAVGHVVLCGSVQVAIDLVKVLLESSDIHDSLVAELRSRLGSLLLKRNGDPRLHWEVEDLDGRSLLFLNDDNLVLVGTLPALGDTLSRFGGLENTFVVAAVELSLNGLSGMLSTVLEFLLGLCVAHFVQALGNFSLGPFVLSALKCLGGVMVSLLGNVLNCFRNRRLGRGIMVLEFGDGGCALLHGLRDRDSGSEEKTEQGFPAAAGKELMHRSGFPERDSTSRKRWKAHGSRRTNRFDGAGGWRTGRCANAGADCTAAEKRPSSGRFRAERFQEIEG
ncbi:hypothetical protein HG531_012549 [Fusarium graminearum]|nr:hypothetical protein HG531_012549 [Fusarium graminearum]